LIGNWTYGESKLTKTERRRTVEIVAGLRDNLRLYLPRGYLDLHNWRRRVFYPPCQRAEVKVTQEPG
jgi:hypothetical protein